MRSADGELRKVVAGKTKLKVKRKVAAKDHSMLGDVVRELSGDESSLNSHGAKSGNAAFGPGSNDAENPPSNSAINQRELQAKERLLAE